MDNYQRIKMMTYFNALALLVLALTFFTFRSDSRDAINHQQKQMQEIESSINAVESAIGD